MIISNTRGDVSFDTGFKVERSFVSIGDTQGDIDLKMGSGKFHNISLSNTHGSASLKFDLGDKTIHAHNTVGSLSAALGNGNDEVNIYQVQGEIAIESGNGKHAYMLHEVSGIADIIVGDANRATHQFNLTDIDGSTSITAGDGNCIINFYEIEGTLQAILGHGNDEITLVNVAADVDLTSGNGNRNIIGTGTGSFTARFGNGNDNIDLFDTRGSISIESGEGLHNATFKTTSGNINIAAGRADGYRASNLFTITETIGSINLKAGKGDHHIIVDSTLDGDILIDTGESSGVGIFDIRGTTNGDVTVMSQGGTDNAIAIVNTEHGSASDGDVTVIVNQGPCTLDVFFASGEIYIDLQGKSRLQFICAFWHNGSTISLT